jgi:hypothetical protein
MAREATKMPVVGPSVPEPAPQLRNEKELKSVDTGFSWIDN